MSKRKRKQIRKKKTKEPEVVQIAAVNKPQKEEQTTIKIVYNETTKKCTIFNSKGQKIAEECAERLAMNFASKRASFTTIRADLETYDIETGEKNLCAFYSGNEIIVRT